MTTWTVANQAPLSTEFSRQEYWSGLPFTPPGDLPDPGIKLASLASPALAGWFFTTAPSGKPMNIIRKYEYAICQMKARLQNRIKQKSRGSAWFDWGDWF